MADPFHDDDPLDLAEQLLLRVQAQTFTVLEVIRKHREHAPKIALHDGSVPVSPVACDEPPSRPTQDDE